MATTEDTATGLQLNALGGAEMVWGRFRNQRIPRHHHDGLMLSMFDDGAQRIRYRGENHVGRPGVIIAIPPEEAHTGEPCDENGWLYRTITIPTQLIRSLTGTKNPYFLCRTTLADRALNKMLAQVFGQFGNAPILALEEILQSILIHFMLLYAETKTAPVTVGPEARAVAACKAYLASRLDQNVQLAELEAISGMEQFRLVKSFTRLEGLPPHTWHIQQRLYGAQDLLSRGAAVADAAYATGFADQAHFTRAFRRLKGITPGHYRRNHLNLV